MKIVGTKKIEILPKNDAKKIRSYFYEQDDLSLSEDDDDYEYWLQLSGMRDSLRSQNRSKGIMCEIHCDMVRLVPTRCCQFNVCDECILNHIRTKLSENSQLVKIQCVNCTQIIPRLDVINRLRMSQENEDINVLEDFMRRITLSDTPGAKECPQCSHVTLKKKKSLLKRVDKGRNSIFMTKMRNIL